MSAPPDTAVFDFSRVLEARRRQVERLTGEPVSVDHPPEPEYPEPETVASILAGMYRHLDGLDLETAGQLQAVMRRNLPEPTNPHPDYPWLEVAWVHEITSAPGYMRTWYEDRFQDTYGHEWGLEPGRWERKVVDRSAWPVIAPEFERWRMAIYGWGNA
jgi:hypothetical protein